jgi:hypothetical protein
MNVPISLRIAGAVAVVALAAFVFVEERAWRQERARLNEQIASAQKQVQEAGARQQQRDTELHDALRQFAQRKQTVRTPEQVIRELPRDLPLPSPIQLLPGSPSDKLERPSGENGVPPGQSPSPSNLPSRPVAVLPAEDLKPLFDFVQDCKACQAERDTLRHDLADEQAKTASLGRERDAALKLAKGGGFWRRTARAAKWFGLGALVGAAAAAAHH